MKFKSLIIIFASLGSLLFLSCKKEEVKKIDSIVVTFLKGNVEQKSTGDWMAIKANDVLPANSLVRTGKDGVIDLSVFGQAGIRLLGGTEFNLNSLQKDKIFVKVDDGNILVKVGKLFKGSSVSVITPTAVAGVRGTEFWGQVTKEKEEGVFAVRDGAVEIQLNDSDESVVVNKGEAVEISPVNKTLRSRKAKDAELNAMSQIDEIKILPVIE